MAYLKYHLEHLRRLYTEYPRLRIQPFGQIEVIEGLLAACATPEIAEELYRGSWRRGNTRAFLMATRRYLAKTLNKLETSK
jgi:hypothetical protein